MNAVNADHIEYVAILVKKVKMGDKKAFIRLYECTWKSLYYTLLKKTGDEDDAEFLLNEVYARVLIGIGKLENEMAFYMWITRVANNVYIDFLRERKRKSQEELCGNSEYYEAVDDDEEFIPEAALAKKEHREMVANTINELPEKQREAIFMFYYLDMKIKEIAEATSSTENTVKKRIHDAKQTLKSKFTVMREKGVSVYNMAGFYVLRELFHEDIARCVDDAVGPAVWELIAENESFKNMEPLIAKSFAVRITAGGAVAGIALIISLQSMATRQPIPPQTFPPLPTSYAQQPALATFTPVPATQQDVRESPRQYPSAAVREFGEATGGSEVPTYPTMDIGGSQAPETPVNFETPIAPEMHAVADAVDQSIEHLLPSGLPAGSPTLPPAQIRQSAPESPVARVLPDADLPDVTPGATTTTGTRPPSHQTLMLVYKYQIHQGPSPAELIGDITKLEGAVFDTENTLITVTQNDYDGGKVGEYTVTVQAVNSESGDIVELISTILVVDTIAPVISVQNREIILSKGGSVSLTDILAEAGVTVTDNSLEALELEVEGYEQIDFSRPGSFALTLNARDSSGNFALQVIIAVKIRN